MRQKCQHVLTEKKVCPPITFLGYTWIDKKVGTFFSRYNEKSDIINLLSWLLINTILKDKDCPIIVWIVQLDATLPPEFVFMNKGLENKKFFYMYECLFWDQHMRLPFDDFSMDVLCALNVALFELHPNKWAAIQAFQALCLYTFVKATLGMFLHYFCRLSHKKARWVSLIRISSHLLFQTFTPSYKKFKITIRSNTRRNFFFDSVGKPVFPFH